MFFVEIPENGIEPVQEIALGHYAERALKWRLSFAFPSTELDFSEETSCHMPVFQEHNS